MLARLALSTAMLGLVAGALCGPAAAATVTLETAPWEDQTLTYSAAPGETNKLTVTHATTEPDGGGEPTTVFTITDSGASLTAGTGCVQVTAHEARCQALYESGVLDLVVSTGDGDDKADVDTDRYGFGRVDLGDGEDKITASSGSAVLYLSGGAGDDKIAMRDHDTLPDDPIFPNGLPLNEIYGDGGDDKISGANAEDWIVGGDGDDQLSGGANKDRLDGGAGDDKLDSHDGVWNEPIECGSGFDRGSADANDAVAGDCEGVERLLLPPLL